MPAQDLFGAPERLDGPAYRGYTITPSDSTDVGIVSRAVYVGVGGDITVIMAGTGNQLLFKGVATGSILPIAISRVMATGTAATNLLGLY